MNLILFLQKSSAVRLWLLSTCISVLMTELIVCGMETLLHGEITFDFLLTGFVASLFVASIIAAGLTYFLDQQRLAAEALNRRVTEEVAKNREKDLLLIQQSRLAAMGEMIGNIAHQWRQPINALTLLLANIKDAYDYKELTGEYLDKEVEIGQGLIQKMSHTIDDFRNFFKPNKEKQDFHVCDGVEEAIRLIAESFKSQHIDIAFEKPGESCTVAGYPNEFAQVVLNALSNAREAIIEKKIAGKVSIRIEKRGDTSTVAIRDNGGGIAETVLPKIFDPYFTTKENGTGIGLYMSKMIMNNMGGDIAIRNVEGGAEALLTLPLADLAV